MKNIKKYQYFIFSIVSFLFVSIIYLYNLIPSFSLNSDFGRDLNDIFQITQGKMTLIGPKLSFGGIFSGPYYYYLFAPVLKIFNLKPEAIVIFNSLIFLLSFALYLIFINLVKIKNKYLMIFGGLWVFTSPYLIYSSRQPGNAFSYLGILFLILISFPLIIDKSKFWLSILYGFLAGIIINFHLVNLFVFAPLLLVTSISYFFQKKWIKMIQCFLIGIGILISFSPTILFEARHNFIQFKNTFIDKSYLSFVDNKNLTNSPTGSDNILINFSLFQKYLTNWTTIPILIIYSLAILLLILKWKKINQLTKIYSLSSVISFVLLGLLAKSQLAIHYFLPFILSIQISIILILNDIYQKKFLANLLFLSLIILNLIKIPKYIYQNSNQSINTYRNFTQELIHSDIFKNVNSSINILNPNDTPIAVLGWGYRYFLKINGYQILNPDAFNQSNQILIIQENNNHDNITNLKLWELDQFGNKKINSLTEIENRKIYLFDKLAK